MSAVVVERVSKVYQLGNQKVHALNNVSLAVGAGEFLAIAGPSGSGKTTLLNIIGCIDSPTSGSVVIGGCDVSARAPDELADLRAKSIGFIFQTFNLLPVLTAYENVEFPLIGRKDINKSARRRIVEGLLKRVDLYKFSNHKPNELSGGQRQRVAIARALAINPLIVLADEPTANLDHDTGSSILELMKGSSTDYGTTYIFSTHDPRVMGMANRLIRMDDGRIV